MPAYPRTFTKSAYSSGRLISRHYRNNGFVYVGPPPLPSMIYEDRKIFFTFFETDPGAYNSNLGCMDTWGYTEVSQSKSEESAYGKAYSRFYEGIHEAADMGLLAAERREAMKLMLTRLKSLTKAASALRKGRFGDFIKALDTRPVPRHRRTKWTKPKDFSALWLEYWFGWSPMLNDIGNVVDVLQGDIPFGQRFRGRGKGYDLKLANLVTRTNYIFERQARVESKVQILANVSVSNPNLFLANQLGFVNPAYIAWQLIPFSFLVDWFIPIGGFLKNYTNNVGLKVEEIWVTKTSVTRAVEKYTDPLGQSATYHTTHVNVSRVPNQTLKRPSLTVDLPDGLSITRGATAISLLVSIFTKG